MSTQEDRAMSMQKSEDALRLRAQGLMGMCAVISCCTAGGKSDAMLRM